MPLRAKLAVVMKEYRPVKVQVRETEETSPTVEKTYVARAGETARARSRRPCTATRPGGGRSRAPTRISDPRRIAPGTVLTIPRLEGPRA